MTSLGLMLCMNRILTIWVRLKRKRGSSRSLTLPFCGGVSQAARILFVAEMRRWCAMMSRSFRWLSTAWRARNHDKQLFKSLYPASEVKHDWKFRRLGGADYIQGRSRQFCCTSRGWRNLLRGAGRKSNRPRSKDRASIRGRSRGPETPNKNSDELWPFPLFPFSSQLNPVSASPRTHHIRQLADSLCAEMKRTCSSATALALPPSGRSCGRC
jgi:hypothetical protein